MKLLTLLVGASVCVSACSSSTGSSGPDAATPPQDDGATPVMDEAGPVDEASMEAGPPTCVYPSGPYGTGPGNTLGPTLSWQGYAANDPNVSTLTLSELFDCDGSKGIDAIIIDTSAGWCAACEDQAHDESELTSQYDQLGIKAITLLIMNAAEQPATTADALAWRMTYNLEDVGIYADPNFLLEPVGQQTIGLPITMIVDPRTMKVVKETEGYGQMNPPVPDPTAVSLAEKNRQ